MSRHDAQTLRKWIPVLGLLILTAGLSERVRAEAPLTEYGYPHALPNSELCDRLLEEDARLLPANDWACGALDGQVYLRTLGQDEFYHGIGHWLQLRSEFSPNDFLRINMRTIFFSGSISFGYTRPLGFYNLLGFTASWPKSFLGGEAKMRLMDLERQTVGAGLMIQDREMGGALFTWKKDDWLFKILADGTGGLLLADDLKNYELSWKDRAVALGLIEWTEGDQGHPPFRDPLGYVSSQVRWNDFFGSDFEVGLRRNVWAGLFRLKGFWTGENLKARAVLQGRSYDQGFGEQFVGRIEHMYISYDQYDKDFVSAGNIFSVDDDVQTGSLILDLVYKLNDNYELQSLNETGRFRFRRFDEFGFYYYRLGLTYRPEPTDPAAVVVFLSNKVLSDSMRLPPFQDSTVNGYSFKQVPFFGIEGRFLF